jgi:SAM-dependent methyltransferase
LLTVQRQHCGDLGSKLDPPVDSLETFALTNWKKFYFRNDIPGGNNGGVDIYFSPQALFAKRLLWFGDSFGRETVRFLSYFFSEILFLRTPFYHNDIVEQMCPDLIISSNVERYLASVVPDENRPLFFMYPFLTGRRYEPSSDFAEAFSAILSYPRPNYKTFVRKLFADRTEALPIGVPTVQQPLIDQAIPLKPQPAIEQLAPPNTIPIPQAANAVATSMKIIPYIHENDFIFKFVARKWGEDKKSAFINYFELGKYSAKIAADLIEEVVRVKKTINQEWSPARLLDFASGYGGVARHLANVFPKTLITTCDIHDEAVTFNRDVLRLESYLSSPTPEALAVPQQDVIVAMSFFSHMPNATYTRWLQSLANRLEPGGVLIFTANGFVTEMRGTTGVKAGDNGFGFEPRSEQKDLDGGQYGITVSHPRWVIRALEQIPEIRLARFQEGHWWAIQDTYVCIRSL